MSTHLKEKEERILQILEHLAEEAAKGALVIVEGKKDIETLRNLNVEGKIISAKTGGKTLLDIISEAENASVREVILLFDFDRRGKECTKRIKQQLERIRIKTNIKFWCELQALVGKEVKDIEGLTTYMKTLKSKICNS